MGMSAGPVPLDTWERTKIDGTKVTFYALNESPSTGFYYPETM